VIRIILIDDHELVRDGVSRLLEAHADMTVIGSFGDAREAVRFASREEPDVAIVDVAMPTTSGIDVARQLRDTSPDTHVLVLSMHSNPEYVRQALLAGALGYVAKESAGTVLVEAVRRVQNGQRYISPAVADAVIEEGGKAGKEDRLARLSTREREVLQLLAEGRTGSEIAQRLSLSPKTVETYRARLVEKLGIRDVAGLVRFAIQRGIISLD